MTGNTIHSGNKNKRTALILSGVVLGMFGFGFALVPLYDLICKVTGIQNISLRNSTEEIQQPTTKTQIDLTRKVTVKFDVTVNPSLPWNFTAQQRNIEVHPGKIYQVNFSAQNRSSAQVTGQAIPSVIPWQATPYFSKLECFCFSKQTLAGNQTAEMPLRFMVSPDLPKDIHSLTLSYSFMKLKQNQDKDKVSSRQIAANEAGIY